MLSKHLLLPCQAHHSCACLSCIFRLHKIQEHVLSQTPVGQHDTTQVSITVMVQE
jgi:hypothetical protein